MIRAIIQDAPMSPHVPIIFCGLSDANVDRLTHGKPVFVHHDTIGAPASVIVAHGATEQDIADEMTREGLGDYVRRLATVETAEMDPSWADARPRCHVCHEHIPSGEILVLPAGIGSDDDDDVIGVLVHRNCAECFT